MRTLLFITGFLSSSAQFVLLREISCLGGDNENTTAVFFALWLLLSSLGTIPAKKNKSERIDHIFLILITSPLLSLFFFLLSEKILIQPGELMTTPGLVIMLLLTLAPVAAVSSFVLVKLSIIRNNEEKIVPGNSFGLETAGSVIAGILTSATALIFIGSFSFYFMVIAVSAALTATVILKPSPSHALLFCVLPAAVAITLVLIYPPDYIIRNFQLKGIHTVETFDTPYGNITKGKYKDEETLFYNFHPLFYSHDEIQSEEDIHYAMLQSDKPEKVLLISGGLQNHLGEILKYNPVEISYYEHDPGILKAEKLNIRESAVSKIKTGKKDAFGYLMNSHENFNVIIQLTDQPMTLSVNRYYTSEHFANIKKNLAKGGIYACAPYYAYNYVSENYLKALSSVINAMHHSFRNIIAIKGDRLYLIASDTTLSTQICSLVLKRQISNVYVNCDYLNDDDITARSFELLSKIDSNVKANTLIKPVASWYGNKLISEKHGSEKSFEIILTVLILLPLFRLRRSTILMYSSSAALAGLGIIVIFLFQATFGNAHLLSAVILSLMFSGLATGAAIRNKIVNKTKIFPIYLAIILLIISLFSWITPDIREYPVIFTFLPALVFIAGVMTGAYYRALTSENAKEVTGQTYSADLTGSAAGYLVTGTILIPVAGVVLAPLVLSGIILVTLIFVSDRPNL